MARMRSVKPEFWSDQDLAQLSRDARLLYIGLWNLADEHSRLRGDPRYVKGQLFPYDDDLTPEVLGDLLRALAEDGKVVRYQVNGAAYLYLPNLARHQRLETDKVPSRLPGPPDADEPESPTTVRANESARDPDVSESGAKDLALSMWHVAGGMEHVAGTPTAGAPAPRADTAQTLIAEWIANCHKPPPGTVKAQVGKHLKAMLAEGIDPADLRFGLAAWHQKGLNPSTLPSVVNEIMNGGPAQARASPNGRPSTTDSRVTAALQLADQLERQERPP